MAGLAAINIKFKADLSGFSSEMQTALREIDKAGQKFQAIGTQLSTFVTLPILAAGGAAIKFASDYNESLNKVDVAFKSSSDEVKNFSKTSLESFGIAAGTALDMASTFGDMGTSLGLTTGEASKMSTSLVGLAGDLSSFKNISIDIANTALSGIFTGETESLKKLGIVMTEANLQAYAYSQGINTKIQAMDQASKVQLRYNYIMEVTKNAQGDFARNSGGAANQMRIFQESLKQVAQQFGAIILPVFTKLVTGINGLITSFGQLSEGTKTTIVVLLGVAAAIGPLVLGLGAIMSLLPTLATGFTLLTGPIGLVIAGLVAVGVVVATNWKPIKQTLVDIANYFIDLYNSSTLFRGAVEFIILSFKNMWTQVKFIFGALKSTFEFTIKNIFNGFSTLGKLIKAILTFDLEGVKSALKSGFSTAGKDASDYYSKLKSGVKDAAKEIKSNLKSAIDTTLNGKKIKKITISKESVDAKGVSDSVEEGMTIGAGKGAEKAKRIVLDSFKGLQIGLSEGSIAYYDAQIAELEKFKNEVAINAQQIQFANDRINQIKIAKDLKFNPEAVIQVKGGFDKLLAEMQAKAGGLKAVSDSMKTTVYDVSATIGTAVTELANNAAVGFGEAIGGVISGTQSLGSLFSGMIGLVANFMKDLGKQLIAIGIARIAFDKLKFSGIGAVAAGIALVALSTVISSKFNQAPKFATGGVVGGSSYYGDKVLARVNSGELILNQDQQRNLYGQMNGGATTIIPDVRIQGQDLLLVFDRATTRKNRMG